jgi:hypothetical protein
MKLFMKLFGILLYFAQYGQSSSWNYHREKKSVVAMFSDAEYISSTRHIRIEGMECPDLDPKKLLPNDPDGARAIGGIHNQNDPVLRMLLSCETVPSLDATSSCSSHPNVDMFVWQVQPYIHLDIICTSVLFSPNEANNWFFILFYFLFFYSL